MQISSDVQVFETERFSVVALAPAQARAVLSVLLQDEALAARVPWMHDYSQEGAQRAAFGIQLGCGAGNIKVWSIVWREQGMQVGAILAKNSLEGIDVEVLVASRLWDYGVAEEAGDPVVEWLAENSEVMFALDGQACNAMMSALVH